MLPLRSLLSLCVFALTASAHTYVWSVWVNGVDQGSGNGIRLPAYNGPMAPINAGYGFYTTISVKLILNQTHRYANSPVRDLTKPEMACNVMGEIPNNATIQAAPGDVVTYDDVLSLLNGVASDVLISRLEWHHNFRNSSDDIIDASHKGSGLVYLSPDPPIGDSWVRRAFRSAPKEIFDALFYRSRSKRKVRMPTEPGTAEESSILGRESKYFCARYALN